MAGQNTSYANENNRLFQGVDNYDVNNYKQRLEILPSHVVAQFESHQDAIS